MPEAAPAAVAPTPTTHPNAPQNGAAPPAQGATTQTPPPAAGSKDWSAEYKKLESEHQKKVREQIVERRKWESDRKTQAEKEKAYAEKLSRLEQLEKREASARLNPGEFLKSIYGDNWHEVLTEFKVSGGTPAQLVQAEMQKLRDELEGREKSKAEEAEKARAAQQEQAQENARRTIFAECAAFYRAKTADYPIFAQVKGGEPAVARMLSARIEHEFNQTGKILTTTEVADLIEGEVLEWAAGAMKHEKYKPKLQPSSTSTTVAKSPQQQGQPQSSPRRSITNDITGSTSPATPPASEKERRERSIAAYEAARRKG